MNKLSLKEALELKIGDRVLVHTLDDGDKKLGTIEEHSEKEFGVIGVHDELGLTVVYDSQEGFDFLKELFKPFASGKPYAEVYKIEGGL